MISKTLLLSAVHAATYTASDDVTFEVNFANNLFEIKANNVPTNGQLALALGATPASTDTDIIVFAALGNGVISDKFGTWTSSTTTGDTNSLQNTSVTVNNGKYNFVAYRAADTGSNKDTVINCGSQQTFSWQVKPSGNTGNWELSTNADCGVNANPANGAAKLVGGFMTAGLVMASLF